MPICMHMFICMCVNMYGDMGKEIVVVEVIMYVWVYIFVCVYKHKYERCLYACTQTHIYISFVICMLTLLLMPLVVMCFCVGSDLMTPSL
jgi:hypothetical protein